MQRIDAAPLVDAVGEHEAGVGRWLDLIGDHVEARAPGLADGLDWLTSHRPCPAGRPVLCHGDLWAETAVEGGRVTGVIDWSLATVSEPALEVGFTSMSLLLSPLPVPRAVLAVVRAGSRQLCGRYLRLYRRGTTADLSNLAYYEALRCAVELTLVVTYRHAVAAGLPSGTRPTRGSAGGRRHGRVLPGEDRRHPLPPRSPDPATVSHAARAVDS